MIPWLKPSIVLPAIVAHKIGLAKAAGASNPYLHNFAKIRRLSIDSPALWRAVGVGMVPQPVRIGGLLTSKRSSKSGNQRAGAGHKPTFVNDRCRAADSITPVACPPQIQRRSAK